MLPYLLLRTTDAKLGYPKQTILLLQVSGMMFDYFSSPPPSVTLPDLLPTAPPNFERRTEFPMVSSADMSECSEISELDVLLEGISSNGMTQEFDAWLKDMPCPDLGPCEL